MGRDEGKGTRGCEALYLQAHPTPAVDHAGYSGNLKDYLTDASGFTGYAERVISPRGESELLAILAAARDEDTPITISGGRTGVTGGGVPQGGWLIALDHFQHLEIGEGRARAGAGVLLKDLHAAAVRTGQFYAPDPTETWASLGGTIATNASGSRSFRYGPTRKHVLALRVALADGTLLDLRRGNAVNFDVPELPRPRTTKHTAGYDLRPCMDWLDLFIGSEGTLGIVIEAELRLLPAPEELLSAVVFFAGDEPALDAVDAWRRVPDLRMLEYLDAPSLALLRGRYPEVPRETRAALLIEQEVTDDEEFDRWTQRLEGEHALMEASWFGVSAEDRERFRQFRHALPELVNDTVRRNGCLKMGTDFAVPLDRNREMLAIYRRLCEEEFPGRYVIFGHIGDAHLHVNLLPANEQDSELARALMIQLAKEAVALGGTVSAEHGLGKRKAHLLALEFTAAQIEAMKAVKLRLDPHWRLGQGNVFTSTSS